MNFREHVPSTPAESVDPRYATARDAAIRCFFNRFGRPPTEDEFRQSIGHFLPAGVSAMPVDAGNRDAPMADALPGQDVLGARPNTSHNKNRAYIPHSPLGEYFRFQALKEFGPFVPPIP